MSSKSIIMYINISRIYAHTHTHGREPSPSLPFNHYHQCLFGTFAFMLSMIAIISTISHAKSHASRAASPPDRQKRGDSEVLLEEKKREAPEGACSS